MGAAPSPDENQRTTASLLVALLLLGGLLLQPSLFGGPPARVRGTLDGAPRFLRYLPSALEVEWGANIGDWQQNVCARMAASRVPVQRLLDALDQQHYEGEEGGLPLGSGAAALDALEADGLLSVMEYSVGGGRVVRVRMAPLIGMLRDPRIGCPPHKYGTGAFTELRGVDMYERWQVQSRMWLFMDPRAAALHNNSRALLLDLGASTWSHVYGARWIKQRLEAQGARFEHVWAWEATPTEPRAYFQGADAKQLAALHFFNWPVAAEPRSPDNPWALLRAAATPSDHVVIKLDIDTEAIDNALAQQILETPALLGLVDELYFEFHFSNPDIAWLWKPGEFVATVADTYAFFSQLRHKGVRANPWP